MDRFLTTALACLLGVMASGTAEAAQNTRQPSGQIGIAKRGGATDVPANYKDLVVDYLKRSLIDPGSVRDIAVSVPADRRVGLLNGFRRPAVCVSYDAKNAFGAYTGTSSTVYWFDDGEVAGARRRPAFCGDASYTRHETSGRAASRQTAASIRRAPLPAASAGWSERPAAARSARPTAASARPGRARETQPRTYEATESAPSDREFVDERRRGGTWFRQL